MNVQAFETMSLVALTAIYNTYADKPIKKFSCSRAEAIERIKAVLPKVEAVKKPRGLGIGKRTVELLKAGNSIGATLLALRAEFGETASSINAVYWYSSKVKRGEL